MQQWSKQDFKENLTTGCWVVKYGAEWCKPCRKLESLLDSIHSQFPNLKFVAVDGDEMPQIVVAKEVSEYPTLVLYINGNERARIEGMVDTEAMTNMLNAWNLLVKVG